jgi:hypothetical protein
MERAACALTCPHSSLGPLGHDAMLVICNPAKTARPSQPRGRYLLARKIKSLVRVPCSLSDMAARAVAGSAVQLR